MGSTTIPAASGGAAPFLGAGSVVVQTQQTKGFYTTTLAAGSYIVAVQGITGGAAVYNQNAANSSNTPTYGWSYYSYANSQGGVIPTGNQALIKVTTSDTYYFGWEQTLEPMQFSSYSFYNSLVRTDSYMATWRYSPNADYSKYFVVGRNADSNFNAAIVNPVTTWGGNASAINGLTANFVAVQTGRTRVEMCGYFGNKYYIAFQENNAHWYSTDAVTWTSTTTGLNSYTKQMAYANTTGITYFYAAVGDSGVATTCIISSTDGITWGTRTSATGTNGLLGIVWGNGLWVAVGQNGQITTSTDTVTWSSRTSPQTSQHYNAVVFQNNLFFAMQVAPTSTGVNAAVSTNGTTWTAVTMWPSASAAANSSTSATTGTYLNYIPYYAQGTSNSYSGNSLFTGGGYFFYQTSYVSNSQMWISTNGTSWGLTFLGSQPVQGTCYTFWNTSLGALQSYICYNNGAWSVATHKPANIVIYNSTIS